MFKYIDTHAHLDMSNFDEDRELVIKKLQEENIGVVTIGTDKKSSIEAVALADKYENVFATIGYHPTDAEEIFEEKDFEKLVQNKKVVGIGECGLDYFRLNGDFEVESKRQKENFKKQIDFAVENDLPIVVHCRDAHDEVLKILKKKKISTRGRLKGVVHFFSGGVNEVKQYLDLGFSFSFGGVITFTDDYNEVIKFIPTEKILSETDSPFVTPVPYRGQRNNPLFIKEIIEKISEIKREELAKVRVILVQNAKKMFALPSSL